MSTYIIHLYVFPRLHDIKLERSTLLTSGRSVKRASSFPTLLFTCNYVTSNTFVGPEIEITDTSATHKLKTVSI